ncbi:LysR family transcriptional regulator [Ectopseudomonas mendocina]|uniref:LysR family transcriptional regulator n=1 Tax=Ectopseudomonas mendocina TaxID=300 RepID=A0ABZ2RM45_ECTME
MKLSQLNFFCTVVEHGTIAAAAERLHCVPSNITTRIKELEEELGASLFSREKNRLLITPQGRLLYSRATQLLQLAQETKELFVHDAQPQGVLRMGALDVALTQHLPPHIVRYRRTHPKVELHIRPGHSFQLERLLVEGELDLIVTDGPIEHPLLASSLAFNERLVLITPKEVRETADELNTLELYVFGKNCYYRHQVDQWISERIKPRAMLEIESYPTILACVSAGLGFACIPESILNSAPDVHAHLNSRALDELPSSDIYYVWRKQHTSPLVENFMRK